MPTENEFKFVLNTELDALTLNPDRTIYIKQGYLNEDGSCRVRLSFDEMNMEITPFFTYKKKLSDRLVEIETKISERDFNDLYENSINNISKIRYEWNDYVGWSVDFFLHPETFKCYLVMAEVELPEGETPTSIPEFIEKEIIYKVPQSDIRFCNANLHRLNLAKVLIPWSKNESKEV